MRADEYYFYRFVLTEDVVAADGDSFVIDTIGSSINTAISNDTEIGLYRADGTLLNSNDAIDFNGIPQIVEAGLTYGIDTPLQNSSGDLAAGEYFLALTTYDSTFSNDFGVSRGDPSATGTYVVNFNLVPGAVVIDPDFNDDGNVDGADIDLLQANIVDGPQDPATFDLTGDGLVTIADRDEWLAQAGAVNLPSGNAYLLGDANLDGNVDGQDFITWNDNKFTTTSAWTNANFNADPSVDGQDFIIWNDNKFQAADNLPSNLGTGSNPFENAEETDEADERLSQRNHRILDNLFAAFA